MSYPWGAICSLAAAAATALVATVSVAGTMSCFIFGCNFTMAFVIAFAIAFTMAFTAAAAVASAAAAAAAGLPQRL